MMDFWRQFQKPHTSRGSFKQHSAGCMLSSHPRSSISTALIPLDFLSMSQTHSSSNRRGTGSFYSQPRTPSSSNNSTLRPVDRSSSSSSLSRESSPGSTPLSSRDTAIQQVITGLAACQKTVEELLQTVKKSTDRIEELANKVSVLDDKVDKIYADPAAEIDTDGRGKKRKRTKSSLLVQEEVHKLHNSRDTARQYKGRETATSAHNKKVTQLIVDELCRQGGFTRAVVQRTAQKYHEHIRRTALGKITDDVKEKKKKNLRKERKFERRRGYVREEPEKRAFAQLNKEHMSSDDTDPDDEEGWVSRPPAYRSGTLVTFMSKLDKRSEKDESSTRTMWKRTKSRRGEQLDKEPPTGTPKWALSDEWKGIMKRREEDQRERENDAEPDHAIQFPEEISDQGAGGEGHSESGSECDFHETD